MNPIPLSIKSFFFIFCFFYAFVNPQVYAGQQIWHYYYVSDSKASAPVLTGLEHNALVSEYSDDPTSDELQKLKTLSNFEKVILIFKKPISAFLFSELEQVAAIYKTKKISLELRLIDFFPVEAEVSFFNTLCQNQAALKWISSGVPGKESQTLLENTFSCNEFVFGLGRYPRYEEKNDINTLPTAKPIGFWADHFPAYVHVDNLNLTGREIFLTVAQPPYDAQSLVLIGAIQKLSGLEIEFDSHPDAFSLELLKQKEIRVYWNLDTIDESELAGLQKLNLLQFSIRMKAASAKENLVRKLSQKVVFLHD